MRKVLGVVAVILISMAVIIFGAAWGHGHICPLPKTKSVCYTEERPIAGMLASKSRVDSNGVTHYFDTIHVCECRRQP